jgi:hypothetical protein
MGGSGRRFLRRKLFNSGVRIGGLIRHVGVATAETLLVDIPICGWFITFVETIY